MIELMSNTDIYHISLKTNIYHSTIWAQIFLPIRILKKMNLNITHIDKDKQMEMETKKNVELRGLLNAEGREEFINH